MNTNPRNAVQKDVPPLSNNYKRVIAKTILFDFDGTLCFRTPMLNDVINAIVEPYFVLSGEQIRVSRRFWHYYWAPSAELVRDELSFGPPRSDLFWSQYLTRYFQVIGIPPALNSPLFAQILPLIHGTPSHEALGADVISTLSTVRLMGYKMGLLTNREHAIEPMLEKMGIASFFDIVVTAGEVGMYKPSPQLFQHAVERIPASPRDVIYVGDNYYTDVIGALNAGLRAVLVDPHHTYEGIGCVKISTVSELIPILSSG